MFRIRTILWCVFILSLLSVFMQFFQCYCNNWTQQPTYQETQCPKDKLQQMEDAFIQSLPTILGGIIAGAAGFLGNWWNVRYLAKKESISRLDEFRGLLGRWKSKRDELLKNYPSFSESMFGYCARFRDDFKNPSEVSRLCEEIDIAARQANTDENKVDEVMSKIDELIDFL